MVLLADFLRSLSALLSLNASDLAELSETEQGSMRIFPIDPRQTSGAESIGVIEFRPH